MVPELMRTKRLRTFESCVLRGGVATRIPGPESLRDKGGTSMEFTHRPVSSSVHAFRALRDGDVGAMPADRTICRQAERSLLPLQPQRQRCETYFLGHSQSSPARCREEDWRLPAPGVEQTPNRFPAAYEASANGETVGSAPSRSISTHTGDASYGDRLRLS